MLRGCFRTRWIDLHAADGIELRAALGSSAFKGHA